MLFSHLCLGLPNGLYIKEKSQFWCDFDCASSLICGNKMRTRCNRGFYCRSYCLLNMCLASLCPSSGAKEYYTVVAACGISCCGFSSSWSGVELRVMRPVCRMLRHPANRTHNPDARGPHHAWSPTKLSSCWCGLTTSCSYVQCFVISKITNVFVLISSSLCCEFKLIKWYFSDRVHISNIPKREGRWWGHHFRDSRNHSVPDVCGTAYPSKWRDIWTSTWTIYH